MKKTDHCLLCDHHQKDLYRGVFCGLTKEKPQFDRTCISSKFDHLLIQELKELATKDHEHKVSVYKTFIAAVFTLFVGLAAIIGDYIYYQDFFMPYFRTEVNKGLYALFGVLILLFAFGAYMIMLGLNILVYYFKEKREIKNRFNQINSVLSNYGLDYDIFKSRDGYSGSKVKIHRTAVKSSAKK